MNLLDRVTFSLPEKRLGLVFGRSGSGKTTLLQVLAGLAYPTEGSITISKQAKSETQQGLYRRSIGIVFQFPERYFLADTVLEELTFGWPTRSQDPFVAQQLFLQLYQVASAVGLTGITWDANPRSLSDGYKRRLALAVQLVRKPDLLLLDEPLAGLDWRARADVVKILASLKQEITLIVVSHDLKELAPLVDKAWRMDFGGQLNEQSIPL